MSERNDPPVGDGVSRPLIAALVMVALVLVLAIQNSEKIHLHLLFWTVTTPAFGLVAISGVLGAAVGWAVVTLWRHRRQD